MLIIVYYIIFSLTYYLYNASLLEEVWVNRIVGRGVDEHMGEGLLKIFLGIKYGFTRGASMSM